MPARPVARALSLGAIGTAVFWGCTLDWSVRGDPIGGTSSGNPEAATDAPLPETDAAEGGPDATTGDADAGPCGVLQTNVDKALVNARACTAPGTIGECQTTVKNECDCEVVVRMPASQQTVSYTDAVKALLDSGCPTRCTGALCKSTTGRNCLQSPSTAFECYPAP